MELRCNPFSNTPSNKGSGNGGNLGSALIRRRAEAGCHAWAECKREAIFAICSPTSVLCFSRWRKSTAFSVVAGLTVYLSRPETYPGTDGQQNRANDEEIGQLFVLGYAAVFFGFCDAGNNSVFATRESSGRSEAETGNGQSGCWKGYAAYPRHTFNEEQGRCARAEARNRESGRRKRQTLKQA